MTTEEKNEEIKLIKLSESKNSKNRYNISGSNEVKEEDKDSSKVSEEGNKEIVNLNISSQNKNSNSKIIKEKSEEFEINQDNKSNQNDNTISENKSQSKSGSIQDNSEKSENKNSSFLNSKHYNNLNESEELEESKEENSDKKILEIKKPFLTTGKFMQIQPHFNIFSKRINNLRDNIYENTKKCLIYKSSLQSSENLMRERANSIVKDLVEKIFNIRKMFLDSDKEINGIISDTNNSLLGMINTHDINKNEITECEVRIKKCEEQIGYKLLGKPNFSFMKRTYNDMKKTNNNKI